MEDLKWDSTIPYDALVRHALKRVVIDVLEDAAAKGLPGEHHFYIAFKTRAPGVSIPKHLMEKYPEEMTIVVQHRFWGLKVHDDRFEIGLSFNQRPEHLVVPFDAMVGFVDPSVHFALQFQDEDLNDDEPDGEIPDQSDADSRASEPVAEKTNDGDDNKVVTLDAFRKKS